MVSLIVGLVPFPVGHKPPGIELHVQLTEAGIKAFWVSHRHVIREDHVVLYHAGIIEDIDGVSRGAARHNRVQAVVFINDEADWWCEAEVHCHIATIIR